MEDRGPSPEAGRQQGPPSGDRLSRPHGLTWWPSTAQSRGPPATFRGHLVHRCCRLGILLLGLSRPRGGGGKETKPPWSQAAEGSLGGGEAKARFSGKPGRFFGHEAARLCVPAKDAAAVRGLEQFMDRPGPKNISEDVFWKSATCYSPKALCC